MHWFEILSYLFVGTTIVLVVIGAVRAFGDFFMGRHHEKSE